MIEVLAAATAVQGAATLAAAASAVAVLLTRDPRVRAASMVAALVFSGLAVVTLGGDSLGNRRAELAVAAVAGLIAITVLAVLFSRRPGLIGLFALGAIPFRVPVPLGADTASLLLPLYGVIAAGVLAEAARWLRPGTGADALEVAEVPTGRGLRLVLYALAAVVGLYAIQSTYSADLEVALKNVCLFYAPFAVLMRLLLDVDWSAERLRTALWLICTLAVLFAIVGFYEYATGHLLLSNAKVQEANDLKPYFRVNSLFFDPNIYGRFLVVVMVCLAAWLLWTRVSREVAAATGLLALLGRHRQRRRVRGRDRTRRGGAVACPVLLSERARAIARNRAVGEQVGRPFDEVVAPARRLVERVRST